MRFTTRASFLLSILVSLNSFSQNSRIWATYYGSNGADEGYDVAVDDSGYVYITGRTTSTSAISSGGFQNTFGGGSYDAYLVKFNPNGTRIWGTYYGASGTDEGTSIALDGFGNVYLAGTTNSLDSISAEGYQNSLAGSKDAFLVKFDRNGNRIWATYFGGNSNETGLALELDGTGHIYLAGNTTSSTGISNNGYQNAHGGNVDAYLVKFDTTGTRIWSTYFGGTGTETGFAICIDPSDNIYLTGQTSTQFGISTGNFEGTIGGGNSDAYLAKFSPAGALFWSFYYGGTDDDLGYCLTTEPSGNVYLAGKTASTTGISDSGYQNVQQGNYDNFLVKFTSSGNRIWGTYFGGPGNDECYSLSRSQSGFIYLAGSTTSIIDISFSGFQTNYGAGAGDAFVAKFDPNGNLFCSTYYGASGWEKGMGVATDNADNIYLSGRTNSATYMSYLGHQNALGGNYDAFLVKFGSCMNVGMEDPITNESIHIYPNPSTGVFTLDSKIGEGQIEIFNSLGELVLERNSSQANTQIDLSGKPKGVYYVRVMEKGKFVGVGKLLLAD